MPVVDRISADYPDVAFLAVAGRSDLERTRARAEELFSERILWGLDDSVWELYGVVGQPVTFLVSSDDAVVDSWFGALSEEELRRRIDALVEAPGP